MFPPFLFVMPQRNLNLVLIDLRCTPFDPLHSYPLQLLSIKTVFLIAIPSAQHVSELQALCSSTPPHSTTSTVNWFCELESTFH